MKQFQTKNGVQLTLIQGGKQENAPLEHVNDTEFGGGDGGEEVQDVSDITKGTKRTFSLTIGGWFKWKSTHEEVA